MAYRARSASELPGVGVPDGLHLVLRFVAARALPLAPLAAPAAAVTGARGTGCGPFVPLAPAPGKRIRFAAFAGHVRGRPFLDAVDVVALPGVDAREAEFRAGRVDVLAGEDGPSSLSAVLMLVLESSRAPFDRPEARAAVAGAIDRADIVKHLLRGGDAAPSLLVPALLPPLVRSDSPRAGRLTAAVAMAVAEDVPPLVSQRIVASLGAIGLRVEATAVPPLQARTATAEFDAGSPPDDARLLDGLQPYDNLLTDDLPTHEFANRLVPVASVPVSFRARAGIHHMRVDLSGRLVLEDAWREP